MAGQGERNFHDRMELAVRRLERSGIVPVLSLEREEDAAPVAKALSEEGILCAEVTFRTEACPQVIRAMREACPDMAVGAGTVLTKEQADMAAEAGAGFAVSPGLNPEITAYCIEMGMPVIPGCSGPGDVERAMSLGLSTVKFFPAEQAGGTAMIKAMAAPYQKVRFMPTGGIRLENLKNYLALDSVAACGGTWLVPEEAVKNKDYGKIRQLARAAVDSMLDFHLAHVGINCAKEKEAVEAAELFSDRFHFAPAEREASVFSDSYIEWMKKPYLGAHGHIAIGTPSVERAMAYLERRGAAFDFGSAVYTETGALQAIYLSEEIGGFAVHLVRHSR